MPKNGGKAASLKLRAAERAIHHLRLQFAKTAAAISIIKALALVNF
jgi:hypothetical protein